MAVYASDPQQAPDSDFVDGHLRHLVPGTRGRLLDARRTPVTVVAVVPDRGAFGVRIDAFEDAGTQWDLALDEIARFQFARDAPIASDRDVAELERALARFDRDLVIEADPAQRERTVAAIAERSEELATHLRDVHLDLDAHIDRREGAPQLYDALEALLAEHGLQDLDRDFAQAFVTNPRSGELVKGHAIVLAELGLCRYEGKVPRDPELFTGERARERRAEHLLWRLAFTRQLWRRLGRTALVLYRGAASDGPLPPRPPQSFVSATLSKAVAEAHFEGGPTTTTAVLWRERVSVDRVLMTFLETRAMNERYREAEAVLLAYMRT